MKKLLAMVAVVAMVLMAFGAVAETAITVTGTGDILVPADTAVVTLGVTVRDSDVVKAQSTVNEKIDAIRTNLLAAGIGEENINTDRLRIYAVYDYSSEVEKIVAYNASSYLAIRTKDMDIVGTIIDVAFQAGANMLDGITFSAEEIGAAREEALTEAVKDARHKAEIIAAAAGLSISGIEEIHEGSSYSFDSGVNSFYKSARTVSDTAEQAAAGVGTLVQAAKVSVTSTVSIVFKAQ